MAVRRGPGDLYGMVPRRVFAFFRRAAKEGRSRRSEISLVLFSSPPRRVFLRDACGFAVCLCKAAALSRRRRRALAARRMPSISPDAWERIASRSFCRMAYGDYPIRLGDGEIPG